MCKLKATHRRVRGEAVALARERGRTKRAVGSEAVAWEGRTQLTTLSSPASDDRSPKAVAARPHSVYNVVGLVKNHFGTLIRR